jgi:hypothetical protein
MKCRKTFHIKWTVLVQRATFDKMNTIQREVMYRKVQAYILKIRNHVNSTYRILTASLQHGVHENSLIVSKINTSKRIVRQSTSIMKIQFMHSRKLIFSLKG